MSDYLVMSGPPVAGDPVAAGVALIAADTGRVLMIQRAMIEGENACGKWEFPGGKLDMGESPWDGAAREFSEEVGHPLPDGGVVVATWLSSDGVYRCFVYLVPDEEALPILERTAENRVVDDPDNPDQSNYTEAVAWFNPTDLDRGPRILREECRYTPWSLLKGYAPEQEEALVAAVGEAHIKLVPVLDEDAMALIEARIRTTYSQPTLGTGGGGGGRTGVLLSSVGVLTPPTPVSLPSDPFERFESLVASLSPPAEALLPEHELDGPTPWQVSEDGLTADGHLALWASCHIGFPGCIKPPREESFDFYNLTPALTADGRQVGVGRVTVGTGHAGGELTWRTAAAHYDNSGHTVAIAHAIPDRWGIRLPSVLVASATPEQIQVAREHPLSGDWRKINGKLRLVAALGVNVPGYPVPQALVASGEVQSMFVGFNPEDAAAAQMEADALAESLGLDRGSRIEALRASILA